VPIRKRFHYDWHWVFETGNGDLGNQNPHELDKARWGLGKQELPKEVISLGGRLGYIDNGNVAIICPASRVQECSDALTAVGIDHGVAIEQGLNHQVTVIPVGIVKGLELDATVVVDPAGILDEEAQGLRALYVALTRATKLLTVVYPGELPEVLRPATTPEPQPVG
jgi:hypothetical protein